MRVRVAVRGEGPNDYGRWNPLQGRLEQEGCYLAFVRAAVLQEAHSGTPVHFQCIKADRYAKPLPGGKLRRRIPPLQGFESHAFYSTLEAMHEGARWLVIGTDTDRGLQGRKTDLPEACIQRYEQFRSGYDKAITLVPEARGVSLVVVVPLVKLESWLLADEKGFREAAGFHRGSLPKKPEELYGKTDAKEYLDQLYSSHGKKSPGTSEKARLAASASPPVLGRECSISYPLFLDDIIRALPVGQ